MSSSNRALKPLPPAPAPIPTFSRFRPKEEKVSDDVLRMIEEAVSQGRVTKIPPKYTRSSS